jgi:hypothetical protein
LQAEQYITEMRQQGYSIYDGWGPLNQFWKFHKFEICLTDPEFYVAFVRNRVVVYVYMILELCTWTFGNAKCETPVYLLR